MNNLKRIFQSAVVALGIFAGAENMQAQTIPQQFYGQNAWMPDTIGNMLLNGKLHQSWGKVRDSKATLVRFGGIAPDDNKPTNFQYIKMIDSIRAKGMEPVIQVSFHKWKYTAEQAAQLVQYINGTKGKNVRYWSIGNEPDLEYSYTTAQQVADYIKPFASAMKAADPTIMIMGPETAWYNEGIINGLTTPGGPHDITGKDAAGRYYVDIISFHYYAFNGTQSRNDVINKLHSNGNLNDNLGLLQSRLATCNSTHGRTGNSALKVAVTEANVNYKNPASDNLNGNGVMSFIGGQFIAEMMSVGMKNNVNFMNVWSVVEGNGTELNIGYLDPSTGNKKPAYYHFQMMAENFRGNFVSGTSNQPNVKIFGSQTGQFTNVMILNQDVSNNFNYTVKLNSSAVGGNSALKLNLNANMNIEYNGVINGQSTTLLTFNSSGVLVKKVEYGLNTHAASNQPPTVTNYSGGTVSNTGSGGSTTGITTAVDENGQEVVSMKGFRMNVFPNPAKSKFTVELDRPNMQDIDFEVEVYDLMGRLIYSKSSIFADKRAEVDLTGSNLASAVYIVRVRESGDKDNTRSEKIVLFKS